MPVPRVCLICQALFLASAYEVNRGYGKYCSRACWRVSNRDTLEERFLHFYPIHRPAVGCWLWTGKPNAGTGYGFLSQDGRYYPAHRLAYWYTVGPIPTGLQVLHTCDTPLCVRGDHLFLGTHLDNMQDKARKGRVWNGRGVRPY